MAHKLTIREMLLKHHTIFEKSAVESIGSLFQKEFSIREPWQVTTRLEGKFHHIFSLGSGDEKFQSLIVIGINNSHLHAIMESDNKEELLDAFGEVCNIYSGILSDYTEITDYFGYLRQSVPQYTNEEVFFPKVWAINGKVFCEDNWLYFGCALRPASSID